jgi:transaldolase
MIAASMRISSQVGDLAGADVFTIPPKVAKEFLASSPDPASLSSLTGRSFEVQLTPGVDPKTTSVLWDVDDNIQSLADDLKSRGPITLTGDDLRQADQDHGCGLFYRFSPAEVEDIKKQGKIPNLERWKSVPSLALDTLMTESALQSFAVDQEALDEHLRSIARSN